VTYTVHVPHAFDQAALEHLVDEFIARRYDRGLSHRDLAAECGVSHASVYYVERRRPANPLVRTLQDYAAPLDYGLCFDFDGLPYVDPSPAVSALFAGGYLGTAAISYLRQIREHLGITRMQIQEAHGWNWSSLAACENSDHEPLVSTIQRFARCLGGRAIPRWEEL
jgi:DNA-binding XRE family transcriptional regulator